MQNNLIFFELDKDSYLNLSSSLITKENICLVLGFTKKDLIIFIFE